MSGCVYVGACVWVSRCGCSCVCVGACVYVCEFGRMCVFGCV